jgi:hypothetical protein
MSCVAGSSNSVTVPNEPFPSTRIFFKDRKSRIHDDATPGSDDGEGEIPPGDLGGSTSVIALAEQVEVEVGSGGEVTFEEARAGAGTGKFRGLAVAADL